MKAIKMTQFGGPEVLKIEEAALGQPKKGEAVVAIKAAGINFIDIYQRRGTYPVPLPYIPGLEAAGVVESVGEGVANVKPGDRVAYVHTPGAYAEKCIIDAKYLIPLPEGLSFEQGAAFPLQGTGQKYSLYARLVRAELRLGKVGIAPQGSSRTRRRSQKRVRGRVLFQQ